MGDEDNVIAVVQVEEDIQRHLADSIRGIPVTASDIHDATKRDPVLQKYHRTADGLSHQTGDEDNVIAVVQVEEDVQRQLADTFKGISVTASGIHDATKRDPILQKVMKFINTSWPQKSTAGDLTHFFRRRQSLSIIDGCVMCSDRVVVPASLRRAVLRKFHCGHPGISRMKALARGYAYRPAMDIDIDQTVNQCSRFQEAAKLPARKPPSPWPKPETPWSRLHIDFAGPMNGISYLIIVDAYSKWPEVIPLRTAISPHSSELSLNTVFL
ncbi:unnamed protein product [Echinostoma caproni]|uniref:Integrase_H2C2 domain-containing protein n=1 Tax=Echinostoma caproni TaxID=27848 RepID=A0A183BH76_9TREM|nr:unnamed protein product [Echinostoma caproni]